MFSLLLAVILSWDAVTTNSDGTPCTDLAGYDVHYGPSSRNYTTHTDAGNVTSKALTLSPGTYFFAVTARDTSGNVSGYSNEVVKVYGEATPVPTATSYPTATNRPTGIPTSTATASPSPTASRTPTKTPSRTPTRTKTPTPRPTLNIYQRVDRLEKAVYVQGTPTP